MTSKVCDLSLKNAVKMLQQDLEQSKEEAGRFKSQQAQIKEELDNLAPLQQ